MSTWDLLWSKNHYPHIITNSMQLVPEVMCTLHLQCIFQTFQSNKTLAKLYFINCFGLNEVVLV